MVNFLVGFALGAIIAVFVYRNNKAKIGKMADKIDDLYKEIADKE